MKRVALLCLSLLLATALTLNASAFRGSGGRGGGGGVFEAAAVPVLSADREAAARFGDRWVVVPLSVRPEVPQYADRWVAA